MTSVFKANLIPAAFAGTLAALCAPAAAQDKAGDKVNMVIAYDESECPEAVGDEIVICEILVEAERYRIPSNLRQSGSPENTARTGEVVSIRYITESGAMSCSPAGAGGFTGCTQQFIDKAYAEREQGEAVRFSQLIEQARQERLSTIDQDAAAEQGRVEQIEREYLERLERERNQPLPGEQPPADVTVQTDNPLAVPPQSVTGPVVNEEPEG